MSRIEVLSPADDGRAIHIQTLLRTAGHKAKVRVVDVYTSKSNKLNSPKFTEAVTNPITQTLGAELTDFNWALEIGFLPGVTDNIGHTATELLTLAGDNDNTPCYSSRLYLIQSTADKSAIETLSEQLANKLIQRIHIKDANQFAADNGMDTIFPEVTLSTMSDVAADTVDLNLDDDALIELSAKGIPNADDSFRGPLGLPLIYMQTIKDYYAELGRPATDIELETLAQTWSEHCKHTIFASPIDEVKDGLYKHYIKRATKEIRTARGDTDICVSVFSDNAGGIIFDDNHLITDKVETHNSPSALDPFGGAITGIVGVNRDCVGFGMGAKPVINRYGYCLADPRTEPELYRDKACTNAVLSPKTIMNGVIAGVEAGGNCSGIPTPQGFAYFDERFVGKPLVFVGTIGLIPRIINGKAGHEKCAQAGDKIIMVGGRVGRDGIHGATFSSVALDEGSPATAVQIGDPITQKKMCDAIIKEIRDTGLYTAITDNGAGGLASSVGEMAEQSGGFHLELDKVPLKYPGMAPWEIWISESQERMTLAVPPENCEEVIAMFAKRGSEATVIGTYTNSGQALITYNDETVMDITMDFLHDGNPETPLTTTFTRGTEAEPDLAEPDSYEDALLTMIGRLNVCSKEFIATQYDHNVQGSACLGPLQGKGRVYAETTISKPLLSSEKGVVLSQGIAARYSDIDTYHMATAGLDTAVRNAVAAGVDFQQLALLDNFCWCSSDEPERLGQLKRAVQAIYDLGTLYGTPFISGKDSMFNDFKGYDKDGNETKISAPPTLLVSSIGVIPNVKNAISLAPKAVGDLIYLLGETKDELGASEYYNEHGVTGQNVPETNGEQNCFMYRLYGRAVRDKLIASALPVNLGGLGATLAKKAIAGQLGLDINLEALDLRGDKSLFSESQGRILVTIAPQNKKAFEKTFKKFEHVHHIGHVMHPQKLSIKNLLSLDINKLDEAYKAPLRGY